MRHYQEMIILVISSNRLLDNEKANHVSSSMMGKEHPLVRDLAEKSALFDTLSKTYSVKAT